MATNYLRWEGTRRGARWEKPALAILGAAILASGAHAFSNLQRHKVATAHCARGEEAWCQGRLQEAEREFTAALAADPYLFVARDQLSILAWQQGEQDRSLALLRDGVRLHPKSQDAYRALGETLFLMHDFAAAVPVLEEAERRQPTEPGKPSLLQTCRQALADPTRFDRRAGLWTGLRTHAKIHSAGHLHAPGNTPCCPGESGPHDTHHESDASKHTD
jgi:tetratricopeptide (TPR) repeat protein